MEYGGIIWDLYTETYINRLERIQRQAERFTWLQETTGHGKKGVSLDETRTTRTWREKNEPETYIFVQSGWGAGSCYWIRRLPEKSTTQKIRLSLLKKCENYQATNIVEKQIKNKTKWFDITSSKTHQFSNSFFVKTLIDWNHLEDSVVWATSVESFKSAVSQTVNKWTVLSLPLDISQPWLLQRSSLSLAN